MFELIETIGNLFAIGFWIVSIAAFVVGIIACIYKLIKGSIGAKCLAVIGAILGVVAFAKMYDWTEHIAWCMFLSGFVVCLFTGVLTNGEEEAPTKKKKYGLSDALVDAYVEQEVIKEATKKAIRELENER